MIFKRHPLASYFVLTYGLLWGAVALGRVNVQLGFFAPIAGALAPGVVALVLTGVIEGEAGVRALVRRLAQWRVAPVWYVAALGLPLAAWLVAAAVARARGAFSASSLEGALPVLMFSWIMLLFAAVEELGWRGFALPRLLASRPAVTASLILGLVHAIWHVPLVVPAAVLDDPPRLAAGLLRGMSMITAEAVLITWIFKHTHGSLLPVTLYHGMTNVVMVLHQGIEGMPWLRPAISVLTATAVVLVTGPTLLRRTRLLDQTGPRADIAR